MRKTIIKCSNSICLSLIVLFSCMLMSNAQSTIDQNKEKMAKSIAYRQNLLVIGGVINSLVSIINVIIAGVNLLVIYIKFQHCLVVIRAKLNLAIQEVKSKDLHPKLKFGLLHYSFDTTKQLPATFQLINEPSPFDSLNDLFPNQKETRLRKKMAIEPASGGPQSETAASSKMGAASDASSAMDTSKM